MLTPRRRPEVLLLAVGHALRLEVDGGHADRILPQLDADEIAGMGIQTVDVGLTAAHVALLAEIVDESLLDQFVEKLGDRGHAQHQCLAQLGNAGISANDVLIDDLLLDQSGSVPLLGLSE